MKLSQIHYVITPQYLWCLMNEFLFQIQSRIPKNSQYYCQITLHVALNTPRRGTSILRLSFVIQTKAYISPKYVHYIKDTQ